MFVFNKKSLFAFFVLLILTSCEAKKSSSSVSVMKEEMPEDFYRLPEKDIEINYSKPSTIDLRGIRNEITWFYTPALSDCFGYNDEPGYLSVKNNDKLVSAKLIVNYYPTIWSDENDHVIQLIELPTLSCKGSKDLEVDYGRVILLRRNDLFFLPENVKQQVSGISRQDLLTILESAGTDHEFENWSVEKKIWKRYISKYTPGDFALINAENNRFGTYPNTFYLQLHFRGNKRDYLINLCDEVIIGN